MLFIHVCKAIFHLGFFDSPLNRGGYIVLSFPQIQVGDRIETVRFFHCYKRGVDRVFVDHPMFLEKVVVLFLFLF